MRIVKEIFDQFTAPEVGVAPVYKYKLSQKDGIEFHVS